jgi:DNA-binding response OmpR family regulator
MAAPKERILLVENDPVISDLIARQSLQPLGYRVQVLRSANTAIQEAMRLSPDLIITNLNLPGLSGKDLLVALASQGLDAPVIVISEKGRESDVIQAFRLGANDYLSWPAREAEVVSAVERVLKQVRSRKEREQLEKQLNQLNQQLHQRVRELTTIFAIGKAVISVTDQRLLFEKIVEGAMYITEADTGWLLVRQDRSKNFTLAAARNLPKSIQGLLGQTWDDGISSLVGLSGEPLSLHGDPIKRFKVSGLGEAVLIVPIKVKSEVVGLLVVLRKTARPFGPGNQALLEAVADYASISMVNARLFRVLEERAQNLQQSVEATHKDLRQRDEALGQLRKDLQSPLGSAAEIILNLLVGEDARLNATQKALLRSSHGKIQQALKTLDDASRPRQT